MLAFITLNPMHPIRFTFTMGLLLIGLALAGWLVPKVVRGAKRLSNKSRDAWKDDTK